MSECPANLPTGDEARPLLQPAGHSPLGPRLSAVPARAGSVAERGWRPPDDAAWDAFLTQHRKLSASFNRYGMLDRYDPEDDPSHGADLYERVVFQDTGALTDSGWLDRVGAIARLEARLAALKAEAITAFDDALHGVSADLGHARPRQGDRAATAGERRWHTGLLRSVSDEIGLVLDLHRGAATTRIHNSWELVHNYPATHAALVDGTLTERAAFTIVRELANLQNVDQLRAAEAAVLAWARHHPLQRIKQVARREAARLDATVNDRNRQRALDERSVRLIVGDDGTADLLTTQDAVDAAGVMTSLTRAALHRRRQGDPRTLDQLRADIALARLLPRTKQAPAPSSTASDAAGASNGEDYNRARSAAAATARPHGATAEPHDAMAEQGTDAAQHSADAGPRGADAATTPPNGAVDRGTGAGVLVPDAGSDLGVDARVVIHATAAELAALLNHDIGTGGQLDGHGPLPQGSLRRAIVKALARTSDRSSRSSLLEFQLTDRPPPSDPDHYTPSAALDRYVRQRDRCCRFPGCNRPAEYTDLDHRVAYAEGGRTTAANLHCLCRHHHRLKHEGNWTVSLDPDGRRVWTSPTGRKYYEDSPDP